MVNDFLHTMYRLGLWGWKRSGRQISLYPLQATVVGGGREATGEDAIHQQPSKDGN